jgi:hypothetical protein
MTATGCVASAYFAIERLLERWTDSLVFRFGLRAEHLQQQDRPTPRIHGG